MKKNMIVMAVLVLAVLISRHYIGRTKELERTQQVMTEMITAMQENTPEPEPEESNTVLTADILRELITPAAHLVSAEYTYSNIATITDYRDIKGIIIPFTTEKIIFTYSGTIQAGIDLYDIQFDINNDSKTVYITLPEIQKISHEIDESSYRFETVKDSIFTSIEPAEFTKEAVSQKRSMELKAEEAGNLVREAESNAKNVLTNLFMQSGAAAGYRFSYISAE